MANENFHQVLILSNKILTLFDKIELYIEVYRFCKDKGFLG